MKMVVDNREVGFSADVEERTHGGVMVEVDGVRESTAFFGRYEVCL